MSEERQVADAPTASTRLVLPVGLSTGIGSLPHIEPTEAVELVLRHHPQLPSAPSLPARSRREGMIAQAAGGVRGISVGVDGALDIRDELLDPEDPLDDTGFTSDAFVGMRALLNALSERPGFVKFSLTGPVTFGVALHLAGVELDRAFRVAAAAVTARAAALVDLLSERLPEATPLVFVDEPGMASCVHPGFPVRPEIAVDAVASVLAALETAGAVTGLHCCGRADWKVLLSSGPQVLSLPVDAGAEASGAALAGHLERGGWIAWGAVPTHRPIGPSPDPLWRRLSDQWCRLVQEGCDPVLLRTQAIITPECGLANHGVTQAEEVLAFTSVLADRLHDQAVGVKLMVGA